MESARRDGSAMNRGRGHYRVEVPLVINNSMQMSPPSGSHSGGPDLKQLTMASIELTDHVVTRLFTHATQSLEKRRFPSN